MQNEIELQLEFNFGNGIAPKAAQKRAILKVARPVGHCRVVGMASLSVSTTVLDASGRRVVAVFRPTRNVLKRAFQRGVLNAKRSALRASCD